MGECLAHWIFALFMIDCVGILAYVLLFNNTNQRNQADITHLAADAFATCHHHDAVFCDFWSDDW